MKINNSFKRINNWTIPHKLNERGIKWTIYILRLKIKTACKDENYPCKPYKFNEILLCRMKSEWTRMKSSVSHLRWNQIRHPNLPQGRFHRVRIPLAVYCVIRRARPTNSKFHPRMWIYSALADLVEKTSPCSDEVFSGGASSTKVEPVIQNNHYLSFWFE